MLFLSLNDLHESYGNYSLCHPFLQYFLLQNQRDCFFNSKHQQVSSPVFNLSLTLNRLRLWTKIQNMFGIRSPLYLHPLFHFCSVSVILQKSLRVKSTDVLNVSRTTPLNVARKWQNDSTLRPQNRSHQMQVVVTIQVIETEFSCLCTEYAPSIGESGSHLELETMHEYCVE